MDDLEKFNETSLSEKEDFRSQRFLESRKYRKYY